jgi:hypothetical protein
MLPLPDPSVAMSALVEFALVVLLRFILSPMSFRHYAVIVIKLPFFIIARYRIIVLSFLIKKERKNIPDIYYDA